MPNPDAITKWAELVAEEQVPEAAAQVWTFFFEGTVEFARKKLDCRRRGVFDEEDVAACALQSFISGLAEGRFPQLHDRRNLWAILITLAKRKLQAQLNAEGALKRGGDFNRVDSGDLERFAQSAIQADSRERVELRDQLVALLNRLSPRPRSIALLRMEGNSNDQIAMEVGCSVATVERVLKQIREAWKEPLGMTPGSNPHVHPS